MPQVHNLRHLTRQDLRGIRRVDRATTYGNPFKIGPDGTREEVKEKYLKWIYAPERETLRRRIRNNLKGRDLACWCDSENEWCHATVVMEIANAE